MFVGSRAISSARKCDRRRQGVAASAPAGSSGRYRRVLLKISGEALLGQRQYGVDPQVCTFIARQLREVHGMGLEVAVVVGGGNIFRGLAASAKGMDRATADYMGMLATVMNGLALQDALEKASVPTRVLSAIAMNEVAEPYIRRRAMRHLEKGRVIILAAGTGNPYFTTDTAAALRAVEIGAEVLLKGTKVDGVYDSDPVTNPNAIRHEHLSYAQVLNDRLAVLDATAVSLCMDNDLPIVVFDMNQPGHIRAAALGEPVGTLIARRAELMDELRHDVEERMGRALEAMERDFSAIRTGRASTSLVERITVEYYGTQTPLNQLASISVPEAHPIVIQPWDRGVLGAIEKAIQKSDIGLTPNVDGTVVRLNIPPLTEERRKDLVKLVHKRMEEAKVEIRNHRRDGADELKKRESDGEIGADEARRELDVLQKLTHRWTDEVDRVGQHKEQEIMEVE